ncbi:MAG: hypothetical protein HY701_01420 [Gemmatimonadetes bacterium]|nr:hypothetical protein [Gemmatimonadota bacterium]
MIAPPRDTSPAAWAVYLAALARMGPEGRFQRAIDLSESVGRPIHAHRVAAVDAERGWKVDFIIRKDRSFSLEEFSRRRPATVLGVDVSLTRVEDLILAKLEWSRLGESELQRRDVVQLLEAPWASLDRSYLERWVEELGLRAEWTEVLGWVS